MDMTSAIMLACIIVLPIVILFFLRVNATLVFLSLCLGNVLTQFVATNSNTFAGLLSSSHVTATLHPTSNTWRLVLLLLPVVITTAFMVHSVKGNSRKILNILPAAGVGLLGAFLVVPLLPAATADSIINNSLWNQLATYQSLIVAASAIACLSMLLVQQPKGGKGKHSKHGG
jgi:hypothetical protein